MNQADHKYCDVTFLNNSDDFQPKPLIFDQTKDTAFITNASDFYLSITRFNINNSLLPVLIPDILTYNTPTLVTGSVLTKYALNLGYGPSPSDITWATQTYKAVPFVSQIYHTAVPLPTYYPTDVMKLYENEYYRIGSIQHFLDMLNAQLLDSFDWLKVNSPYTSRLADALAPRFQFNNSKIQLLYTNEFIRNDSAPNPTFYIGMNTILYNLLASFDMTLINPYVTPVDTPTMYNPEMNYVMNIRNNYSQNTYNIKIGSSPTIYYINVLEQPYSSVPFWNPIESIFFTCSSLGVSSLSSDLGTTFTGNDLLTLANPNSNITIITDFIYDCTIGTEMLGSLSYIANEYRLYDLENNNLTKLNIMGWWRDKYGNGTHQIMVPYGSFASMKLMFRSKSFGNN
jgi:hypothetical protein